MYPSGLTREGGLIKEVVLGHTQVPPLMRWIKGLSY